MPGLAPDQGLTPLAIEFRPSGALAARGRLPAMLLKTRFDQVIFARTLTPMISNQRPFLTPLQGLRTMARIRLLSAVLVILGACQLWFAPAVESMPAGQPGKLEL